MLTVIVEKPLTAVIVEATHLYRQSLSKQLLLTTILTVIVQTPLTAINLFETTFLKNICLTVCFTELFMFQQTCSHGHMVSDTRSQTHGLGHTVSDTRSRTRGLGHTVSDTRPRTHGLEPRTRTHGLGHTVSGSRSRTHSLGHTASDTRSRTHGLGHTVPPSAAIVRESNLRNSSNLNCGLPKVKARKVACDECLCVANLFANAGS